MTANPSDQMEDVEVDMAQGVQRIDIAIGTSVAQPAVLFEMVAVDENVPLDGSRSTAVLKLSIR